MHVQWYEAKQRKVKSRQSPETQSHWLELPVFWPLSYDHQATTALTISVCIIHSVCAIRIPLGVNFVMKSKKIKIFHKGVCFLQEIFMLNEHKSLFLFWGSCCWGSPFDSIWKLFLITQLLLPEVMTLPLLLQWLVFDFCWHFWSIPNHERSMLHT